MHEIGQHSGADISSRWNAALGRRRGRMVFKLPEELQRVEVNLYDAMPFYFPHPGLQAWVEAKYTVFVFGPPRT